jgi:hypothetical protein
VTAPADGGDQIERTVLEEVVALHPDHLSLPELVRKMTVGDDWSEKEGIEEAVRELRGAGLLRQVGELLAPTYAALRFAALVDSS